MKYMATYAVECDGNEKYGNDKFKTVLEHTAKSV